MGLGQDATPELKQLTDELYDAHRDNDKLREELQELKTQHTVMRLVLSNIAIFEGEDDAAPVYEVPDCYTPGAGDRVALEWDDKRKTHIVRLERKAAKGDD
jgi:hypothetical protein